MRKTPLRPGPAPRRRREITRSAVAVKRKRVRRVNAARKAREFVRTYHSVERVLWVQQQPSVVDGAGPCVNAHVGRKGAGARRKANADQIVPMTDAQHRAFDEWRAPFDTEDAREAVRARCADVERAWHEHGGSTGKSALRA